mmetsp:Transcript_16416/g.34594  ORF Transcript_16416/g.34594 Transcript_16416/m.34594 type:complete len:315 (-) Transcript_16416:506-1450(-)
MLRILATVDEPPSSPLQRAPRTGRSANGSQVLTHHIRAFVPRNGTELSKLILHELQQRILEDFLDIEGHGRQFSVLDQHRNQKFRRDIRTDHAGSDRRSPTRRETGHLLRTTTRRRALHVGNAQHLGDRDVFARYPRLVPNLPQKSSRLVKKLLLHPRIEDDSLADAHFQIHVAVQHVQTGSLVDVIVLRHVDLVEFRLRRVPVLQPHPIQRHEQSQLSVVLGQLQRHELLLRNLVEVRGRDLVLGRDGVHAAVRSYRPLVPLPSLQRDVLHVFVLVESPQRADGVAGADVEDVSVVIEEVRVGDEFGFESLGD